MKSFIWVNLLHFYQPPHQNSALLKIIAKESYLFLLNFFKKHPKLRLTVNFSGSLTELLEQNGLHKIVQGFKELALKEQIELVGTAKYHPILPLLPEREIKRQIELNDKINKAYFGNAYNPQGFFCPEMAYSKKVGRLVKSLGFQWVILDEIAWRGKLGEVDFSKKYLEQDSGLTVIFRHRGISKSFVPETIYQSRNNLPSPLITATDAEMYGHHHKDPKKYLQLIYKDKNIHTARISSFLKQLKEAEKFFVHPCSWESLEKELADDKPFALWQDRRNDFHKILWQLANLAIKANDKYNAPGEDRWARHHLDRGLASCTWWWLSERKPDAFTPRLWNPDEILKGAEEIIRSLRSLSKMPAAEKVRAEKMYQKFMGSVWEKHWQVNQNIK